MKKTLIAAAVLVALTACNKSLIETPALEGDYGYITFDVSADTEMIETKVAVTDDALSNYTVKLMKVNGENSQQITVDASNTNLPTTYSGFKNKTFKLQAGTYYIEAENQTADASHPNNNKGSKHISGRSDNAVLTPGGTAALSATCGVINTAVTVALADGFTSVFTIPTIAISDNTRTFTFASDDLGHEKDPVYFPSNTTKIVESETKYCTTLTLKISATIGSASKDFTLTREVYRADWNQITLAAGQNGTITVTITATDDLHTPITETITIDPTTGTTPAVQN